MCNECWEKIFMCKWWCWTSHPFQHAVSSKRGKRERRWCQRILKVWLVLLLLAPKKKKKKQKQVQCRGCLNSSKKYFSKHRNSILPKYPPFFVGQKNTWFSSVTVVEGLGFSCEYFTNLKFRISFQKKMSQRIEALKLVHF